MRSGSRRGAANTPSTHRTAGTGRWRSAPLSRNASPAPTVHAAWTTTPAGSARWCRRRIGFWCMAGSICIPATPGLDIAAAGCGCCMRRIRSPADRAGRRDGDRRVRPHPRPGPCRYPRACAVDLRITRQGRAGDGTVCRERAAGRPAAAVRDARPVQVLTGKALECR